MASSVIHMCVTNEVNKVLKRDNKQILLGGIAPDISKLVGETKIKSHFLDIGSDIPKLDVFLEKYRNNLDNDFVLGYYIHLYADYIWFKYFISSFISKDFVYKIDGDKVKVTCKEKMDFIYSDYSNLNVKLLDIYNLDLSLFYEELPEVDNIIKEIPMNQIKLIVDKCGIVIENTKESKPCIFDVSDIKHYISFCVDAIISNLTSIGIISDK